MEQLLIGSVAGALGGNAAGRAFRPFNLGTLRNTITGLLAGGVVSQIIALFIPTIMETAQSSDLGIGGIVAQLVAGGVGGAIVTAVVGALREGD